MKIYENIKKISKNIGYRCEIYPYVYILFTWKANILEATVFRWKKQ